jgi:hypothetical protein
LPLPSDEEILARAAELKLIGPGGSLTSRNRALVVKGIVEKRNAPTAPAVELRSRTEQPVDGGVLRVDVVFIPNQPK